MKLDRIDLIPSRHRQATAVVLIPVGDGQVAETLDTLESVWHYLGAGQPVIVNLEHHDDETERALRSAWDGRLHVIRNPSPGGVGAPIVMEFLTHKNAYGYKVAFEEYEAPLVLKLDTDALLTGYGLLDEALTYMQRNPEVGIFGQHGVRADGTPRSYQVHTHRLRGELSRRRRLTFRAPAYAPIARRALAHGWALGESVFGAACFLTRPCLAAMHRSGYLNPPRRGWNSVIAEDVYFTMCAMAAGFRPGHFAAPDGPLCLAWRRLPLPAKEIHARGYKVAHSVDKGEHTSRSENGGLTAREFFRAIRREEVLLQTQGGSVT